MMGGDNQMLKLGLGARYKISIQTGNHFGAGTDSSVEVCILGEGNRKTAYWLVFCRQ